ncbi:hypothetical protein Adt_05311 [Abeliophyllum distichum]|uniref:Uncharacterized protein n=1 Tax=Abeliophyllum distichum TaxID=126358 RepID=A0ABD1V3Q7_9LAMI
MWNVTNRNQPRREVVVSRLRKQSSTISGSGFAIAGTIAKGRRECTRGKLGSSGFKIAAAGVGPTQIAFANCKSQKMGANRATKGQRSKDTNRRHGRSLRRAAAGGD